MLHDGGDVVDLDVEDGPGLTMHGGCVPETAARLVNHPVGGRAGRLLEGPAEQPMVEASRLSRIRRTNLEVVHRSAAGLGHASSFRFDADHICTCCLFAPLPPIL